MNKNVLPIKQTVLPPPPTPNSFRVIAPFLQYIYIYNTVYLILLLFAENNSYEIISYDLFFFLQLEKSLDRTKIMCRAQNSADMEPKVYSFICII